MARGGEVTQAVVPAAGRGTRLLPATRAVPKELLPLGATPVLDLVLAELRAAGIAEVVLVTSPAKAALAAHVAGAEVPVTLVEQPEPRGLGDAVLCAEPAVAGSAPFAVALPDALVAPAVMHALVGAVRDGAEGAIAVERVAPAEAARRGMVAVDGDGRVTALAEKPGAGWDAASLAVAARYVLPHSIFAALRETPPGAGGEVQLTDAIARLVEAGTPIAAVELPPSLPRRDVGSPAGYSAAFVEHALAHPDLADAVRAAIDARRRR